MTARKRAPGHAAPLPDAPGPAAEPQATSRLPPYADGFTVISVYTRAQAIADGVLADVSTGDLADEARQRKDGHAAGVAPQPGGGARRVGCPKIGRVTAQVSAQHFPRRSRCHDRDCLRPHRAGRREHKVRERLARRLA